MVTPRVSGKNYLRKSAKSAGKYNYATAYTYDFNGNIISLHRNTETAQSLHNIAYQYLTNQNRLNHIITTGINSSAYAYDAIGNLTIDSEENLQISWNAAGKVKQIITPTDTIRFTYSPTGQRLTKELLNSQLSTLNNYYIYDATGNVMCIYTRHGDTLTAAERPLYGSKRLGELRQQIILGTNGSLLRCDNATIGFRHYELTDHLGNVMAVVSDRKTLSTDSMYIPDVIFYTDYYPFGFPIESRSWDLGDYRYGFNGQESDDEVYGEKQSYTAEFWQYDSRLGRRWNVDPKGTPRLSPYACFGDNPIMFNDIFGDTVIARNKTTQKYMKSYFKVQFGSSKMFRFDSNGELKLRKRQYEKALANANDDQKMLLTGISTIIKNPNNVLVQIAKNSNEINFVKYIITGYDNDGFPQYKKDGGTKLPADKLGGGGSAYSNYFGAYVVGISDQLANNTQCSTGEFIVGGTEQDELYPIGTGNSSAVFFHELLDEVLNYHINKTVTNDSPPLDQVQYQNAALRNLHLKQRDALDH